MKLELLKQLNESLRRGYGVILSVYMADTIDMLQESFEDDCEVFLDRTEFTNEVVSRFADHLEAMSHEDSVVEDDLEYSKLKRHPMWDTFKSYYWIIDKF